MPPHCESTNHCSSPPSRFVPSLTCIAEEEPRVVAVRRITVPTEKFKVEIPIYDVNIYEPEPPTVSFSDSYQRLFSEMKRFIGNQTNAQKYNEMVEKLRIQCAIKEAESIRLSKSNFTNRDWYWYSEKTKTFVDKPINRPWELPETWKENQCFKTDTPSSTAVSSEIINDGFDLNADF